jgi:hypothetical protein
MSAFSFISTNAALFCAVFFVTSCANVGNETADINDCRNMAYANPNDSVGNSDYAKFSQCKAEKNALRADENNKETAFIWVEFFVDLFAPSDSAN